MLLSEKFWMRYFRTYGPGTLYELYQEHLYTPLIYADAWQDATAAQSLQEGKAW